MSSRGRTLLLFTLTRMDSMLQKGNVWYLRHYESYFDRVYVAYLLGVPLAPRRQGKTILISLGLGGKLVNLLLAPFRLLVLAQKVKPTCYFTADIFFSWWTALLVKFRRGAKIVLMPVCIPPEVYVDTNRTVIGLPKQLEKALMWLSFIAARRVIMSKNSDTQLKWLRSDPAASRKLKIVAVTAEELPSMAIYEGLDGFERNLDVLHAPPVLLYVGRLHPEKLPGGLVDMVAHLVDLGIETRLVIAGDGESRKAMEARAEVLGVGERIQFLGFVESAGLVDLYRRADIYVSTQSGTSLREAGLFGLPVVGYRADWLKDLMKHGQSALLVEPGDALGLAKQVAAVIEDKNMRRRIALEFRKMAYQRWQLGQLASALQESFAEL